MLQSFCFTTQPSSYRPIATKNGEVVKPSNYIGVKRHNYYLSLRLFSLFLTSRHAVSRAKIWPIYWKKIKQLSDYPLCSPGESRPYGLGENGLCVGHYFTITNQCHTCHLLDAPQRLSLALMPVMNCGFWTTQKTKTVDFIEINRYKVISGMKGIVINIIIQDYFTNTWLSFKNNF